MKSARIGNAPIPDMRLQFPFDPARLCGAGTCGERSAIVDAAGGGEGLLTSESGDDPAVARGAAGRPDLGTGQPIPFESMMAVHRGNARQHRVAAVLLLVVGLVVVALGLLGILPPAPAVLIGAVTAAVSVFPYREEVEREERIEGLRVLEDEWRELTGANAPSEQEREQFLGLLWKLYDKR